MNIVLTGASRGIGAKTAMELCRKDIDRLLLISRNKKALEEVKESCKRINNKVEISVLAEDISVLTKMNESFFWDVTDILINNAGFLVRKPFDDLNKDDIRQMYEVNVFAPSMLIKKGLASLLKSESAHVVNISSMAGFQGSSKFPGLSHYSASKAAIASLTECLAEEYKNTNIRFNSLAFGAVQTEMLEEAFPGYEAPVVPEEMAKYIADFALNGHKYFNGKVIPVSLTTP